ncbi:filamentous hemagglutinin family outer membrane protein [[Leptolyngbya] sp. PCC 7376]|uniref:CHAT domain-containing protein n=1 Tax=[Leptolyngbya] sp. PCC 7376 TaxID=111781 RepID=UPI00029F3512|nr:CHAT domain-containing protein [[Leptolyngbya] sp. PCC 7376]AFY37888.1 filamentous hemagglutinin family outer membrane protein [[Leptolyngbya] sp. PCC 7376]
MVLRFSLLVPILSTSCVLANAVVAIAQISASNDGTGTIVNQQSDNFTILGGSLSGDGTNLFHNFSDFNLSATQTATFLGDATLQNILSKVSGGNPSYLDGLLRVSGNDANLFLLNSAGIVFGENAQLNLTGNFTATTALGIGFENGEWLDGNNYSMLVGAPKVFDFDGTGAIINAADLQVNTGRSLNLFASNVVNTGTLTAEQGNIQLLAVPNTNSLRLNQSGQILGLELPMPSDSLNIVDLAKLLTGSNLETGLVVENNAIKLASTQTPISQNSGNTFVSNLLSSAGESGGNINIFGQAIALESATLDASGTNGGGEILVGGAFQGSGDLPRAANTLVDAESILDASAIAQGNAGDIIVWADNATGFYGQAIATGGLQGGDGGLIETSGKNYLDVFGAEIDTSTINGQAGEWLLDPSDINISFTGGIGTLPDGLFNPPTSSNISPITIVNALDSGTDVTVTTSDGTGGNGDITLSDSIFQTGAGTASLTLTGRNFTRVATSEINLTSSGGLTFNLNSVNPSTATGTELGNSLQAAHDAIGTVAGLRTINLGAGTFARGSEISLSEEVTINGAGQGLTILDGGGASRVIDAVGAVSLQNLTIQNGNAIYGGGIRNIGGTLNLNNVTIANNTADSGGGLYNDNGDVTIADSFFAGNIAIDAGNDDSPDGGGAIANFGNSNLTIQRSTITGNTAINVGGGIVNYGNTLLNVQNSTISGNTATTAGGGIYNYSLASQATVTTLTNSIVADNIVRSDNGFGGGLHIGDQDTAIIVDSLITGNQLNGVDSIGGGISNFGETSLTRTTVANNNARGAGGGLYNGENSNVSLQDSTISMNTTLGYGGGIFNTGSLDIRNSTISGNTAGGYGGGVLNDNTVTLTNSIVANSVNGNDIEAGDSVGAVVISNGVNLVEDGSLTGTNILNLDPALTPLGDYGGPEIGDPNTGTNPLLTNFFLLDSPVIDAGENSAVSSFTAQRGGNRLVGNAIDLGAVEFQGVNLSITGGNAQSAVINTDFAPVTVLATEEKFGNPLANLIINFDAPNSGASLSQKSLSGITDAAGLVNVVPSANNLVGSFNLQVGVPRFSVSNPVAATLTNIVPPQEPDLQGIRTELEKCFGDLSCGKDEPNSNQQPNNLVAAGNQDDILTIANKLKKIQEQTGVNPAIVYVFFDQKSSDAVPERVYLKGSTSKEKTASKSGVDSAEWQFNGDRLTQYLNSATVNFLNPRATLDDDAVLNLILVTPNDKVVHRTIENMTRRELVHQARIFMRALRTLQSSASYLPPSQALHNAIIDPIEETLIAEGIDNLSFILDDGLRSLPVAALYDGEQFLVEKYSLGLMPSFSLTNTSGYIHPKENQLLALGAAEFDDQPELRAAPLEVEIITQDIWRRHTRAFLDQQFTLDNLLNARRNERYGILHLATHAEFIRDAPQRSYIQFQNQKIIFDEVDKLRLGEPPLELLVLSACRTAFGDRQAELGFAGLALNSGAKSVVGSLWSVSDVGTMGLMAEFYDKLQRSPIKANALQQAQLALLDNQVRIEEFQLRLDDRTISLPDEMREIKNANLSHPYYWSGFTLVGNPW